LVVGLGVVGTAVVRRAPFAVPAHVSAGQRPPLCVVSTRPAQALGRRVSPSVALLDLRPGPMLQGAVRHARQHFVGTSYRLTGPPGAVPIRIARSRDRQRRSPPAAAGPAPPTSLPPAAPLGRRGSRRPSRHRSRSDVGTDQA
jgi:hypothetical protein